MKISKCFLVLPLTLFLMVSIAPAATVTVGPTGQYKSPCAAFQHLSDGDTVQVDANNGEPYYEGNCRIGNNNLKIVGVNGRPVLDARKTVVPRGLWLLDGHDVVVDNFEFRNASQAANPGSGDNAAGIWIRNGTTDAPGGGNVTIRHCYIHDNGDGILSSNADLPSSKLKSGAKVQHRLGHQFFSPNPFILFEYDDFYHNGDGTGQTHNFYIGYGGNMKFTMRYSSSRDAYVGHAVKTRAPYNDILYNRITDQAGATSYLLDFPLGGTTNVIGNFINSVKVTNPMGNEDLMVYRDVHDETATDPVYGPPHEKLTFKNNVIIDNNPNQSDAFVTISCRFPSSENCPAPKFGPRLTTTADIEGNLFIGIPKKVTNQPGATVKDNVILPYSAKEGEWINPALKSLSHPD